MTDSTRQVEDEWLVLLAQSGDAAALARLVQRWHAPFLRYAARLIGSADAAHDAAQDAWLAVARGIRRLDDPARFRAWAFRILTNKCADHIRARRRGRRDVNAGAAAARAKPPASGASCGDEPESVRQAIADLDAEARALLLLYYANGLAVSEVAEALAIPAGTVKSRLHHARRRLRERLDAQNEQPATP